jgi:hypothetical protein
MLSLESNNDLRVINDENGKLDVLSRLLDFFAFNKPFDEDEEDVDEEDDGEDVVDIFIACADVLLDLFGSVEAEKTKLKEKIKQNKLKKT